MNEAHITRLPDRVRGHAWTLWPFVRDRARPPRAPHSAGWSTALADPRVGRVRLSGRIHHVEGADTMAVIVHGMASSADTGYCLRTAQVAARLGLSSLRLNLRGADRLGGDYYHAGLTDDLRAVLSSPEVARYTSVVVIGFSLGGHLALRFALEKPPALAAVAAISPPVDLAAACAFIDKPSALVYRTHLLRGLRDLYRTVAERRSVPLSLERARRVRRIRDWDDLVVAPRFGFSGADDYYRQSSVGPRLGALEVPALVVASPADPMVRAETMYRHLRSASPRLEVRWMNGGHVGFPGEARVIGQVLGWLREHARRQRRSS